MLTPLSPSYHAFLFARDWLKIERETFPWDWKVIPQDKTLVYSGIYTGAPPLMTFNGIPSLTTIFHEAVHYRQDETLGGRLTELYLRESQMITDMATRMAHLGEGKVMIDPHRTAYCSNPFEIEARHKSYEMGIDYCRQFPLDSSYQLH